MIGHDPTHAPIFRNEAVQHYIEGSRQATLSSTVVLEGRTTLRFLWFLLASLAIIAAFSVFVVQVPAYVSIVGVVIDGEAHLQSKDVGVAVFVPAVQLQRMQQRAQVGQPLFLSFDTPSKRLSRVSGSIASLASPQASRTHYGSPDGASALGTLPATVVIAQLAPLPADAAIPIRGNIVRVDVEVGTRRAVSLLPVIGRAFGGS